MGVRVRGQWARADARSWGARAQDVGAGERDSVAGVPGQSQDCDLVACRRERKCAAMRGMHVGADLYENERRSCRTMGGQWLLDLEHDWLRVA